MSWMLVPKAQDGTHEAALAAAARSFHAAGHVRQHVLQTARHVVLAADAINGRWPAVLEQGADWIASIGLPVYRGQVGQAAHAALLADDTIEATQLAGHFAAVRCKAGKLEAFADPLGIFPLYEDEPLGRVGTSMAALLAARPSATLNVQSAYEYVFASVISGLATMVEEVRRFSPGETLALEPLRTHRGAPARLPLAWQTAPVDTHARHVIDALKATMEPLVQAFGDEIRAPLSGGYDSRLVLALLRHLGAKPQVYTYGAAGSSEAELARAIGRAEGFEVQLFDKLAYAPVDPQTFPAITAHNLAELDMLPPEGDLWDNGADSWTRHARHAGGWLGVSGGAGEVLRNFFHLPDGRFGTRDIVRSFFSSYDPATATKRFDRAAYEATLERKLAQALEVVPGPLVRADVERAYPLFRGHGFFGREIASVARFGAYAMPFLEPQVLRAALAVPLNYKGHGAFEARLIATLDPALARHRSAYGHDFLHAPSLGGRLREMADLVKPVWFRREAYRLKHLRGIPQDEIYTRYLKPELLKLCIDLNYPAMRTLFHVDKVKDVWLLQRIAALEFVARQLGSKLAIPA
jgi:hypothetical protein